MSHEKEAPKGTWLLTLSQTRVLHVAMKRPDGSWMDQNGLYLPKPTLWCPLPEQARERMRT
jgi:hypothetical protein